MMMRDQADELRQLVRQHAVKPAHNGPGARLVVVAGGKPAVGATTVAVNLAVALARQGRRAVFVDADLERVGPAFGSAAGGHGTVLDVLGGRHTVHEVLERGPSGIQVIAGAATPVRGLEMPSTTSERFISHLRDLAPHAEVVVVDTGSSRGPLPKTLWHAADAIVVVTTSESLAIMDAYAVIKELARSEAGAPLYVAVNQTADGLAAGDVQGRIACACRRFLGMATQAVPHVPGCAASGSEAVLIFPPRGDSARAMDRTADMLWAQLQLGAGTSSASSRQARRA